MKAYLILADGTIFEGQSIGVEKDTIGEVVFTTGMCGYMETLTDPSYYGQLVVHTFPLIGNYGAIAMDRESEYPRLSGYIVRELCKEGSNFRSVGELNDYLIKNNVVGIEGIDTRQLTRQIRTAGVMNAMITTSKTNLEDKLKVIKQYKIINAVAETSPKYIIEDKCANAEFKVVLWDFGAKGNIDNELCKRNCDVIKVPYNISAEEIMELKPDGIMLSNGGGDPSENAGIIEQLKKLNSYKLPTFGICLGHQLLALSNGGKTNKLKYGHRGANQPVKYLETGRVYITSQNHGYVVKSIPSEVGKISFVNANDRTCEGIEYLQMPAFSVQFHPEACGGPLDTGFLFDKFIDLMRGTK